MIPGDITCSHCGWRNEATARMCGGCGQPLRQSPNSPATATVAIPAGWASGAESGATTPVDIPAAFAPTVAAPPTAGAYSPPSPLAAPSVWPGATPAGRRSGASPAAKKNPWRVPIIVLVVLCVLLAAGLGAWALVLRPAIHSSVDSQLRSALDTAIEEAAPASATISSGEVFTIKIPASALNADIENELDNIPVKNVQVQFRANGFIRATYSFLGRDGGITTQLVPLANGRVEAQNTNVTGLLKLVESADEMTATFNEALGRLPPQYRVTQITAANDTLTISVTGQ
ncbi:MAG TPA: hypothetical protein VKT52_06195 [Ktedonobacterales bacterium]|nr:hypothetical protein [Ktedonobacterales bacterium]